ATSNTVLPRSLRFVLFAGVNRRRATVTRIHPSARRGSCGAGYHYGARLARLTGRTRVELGPRTPGTLLASSEQSPRDPRSDVLRSAVGARTDGAPPLGYPRSCQRRMLARRKGEGLGLAASGESRGLNVPHLHEPGEMGLFNVQEICARTKALGLAGKVTGFRPPPRDHASLLSRSADQSARGLATD